MKPSAWRGISPRGKKRSSLDKPHLLPCSKLRLFGLEHTGSECGSPRQEEPGEAWQHNLSPLVFLIRPHNYMLHLHDNLINYHFLFSYWGINYFFISGFGEMRGHFFWYEQIVKFLNRGQAPKSPPIYL